jgi:ATP-dependent DNA helicase RecG
MIEESVEWRRLGLVVAMESTTLASVMPRQLECRERRPDLLVLTRSPLPVRLILTVYTGFELTTLPTTGTQGVQTVLNGSDERQAAYSEAANAVSEGQQVFVAFPVREGKDLLSASDARRMADALRSETFPSAAIGIYCSAMSRDERQRVFDDFLHRRVDVLVCTTFIEDAPEVFNATVMMVEYADLHTAERLHRLRGHVARSKNGGRCFLVQSDSPETSACERLNKLMVERDGFQLAELDLDGHGDRLVDQEAARDLPSLRWMIPASNRRMMIRARDHAFQILQKDPDLKFNSDIAQVLNTRWGSWLGELIPLGKTERKGGTRGRRRHRRRRRR